MVVLYSQQEKKDVTKRTIFPKRFQQSKMKRYKFNKNNWWISNDHDEIEWQRTIMPKPSNIAKREQLRLRTFKTGGASVLPQEEFLAVAFAFFVIIS